MATPTDRRSPRNRRAKLEPAEPLERAGERRKEERRIWARTLRRVTLVEEPEGLVRELTAQVSQEGAQFMAPTGITSSRVEIRISPAEMQELRLPGRVARLQPVGHATSVHVRFDELDVRTELALARLLQQTAGR